MKHPFIFKSLTITQNIALIIYTLLILVKCQTTNSHKLMFYFYGIDWFTLIYIVCCIITAASLTAIIFGGKSRIIYLIVKSI